MNTDLKQEVQLKPSLLKNVTSLGRSAKRRRTGTKNGPRSCLGSLETNAREVDGYGGKLSDSNLKTDVGKKRGRRIFEGKKPTHNMKNFSDYEIVEKLGEGAYGVVSKAVFKPSGVSYAIKKVKCDGASDGMPATTIREIALLKRCSHHNIVRLFEVMYHGGAIHLVFELVESDMHDYLQKQTTLLPMETIKKWMVDMYLGLEFCHAQGILHRDLKPQNMLIGGDGSVKLADFGLSRECHMPILTLTHEVVTLWYRCPEVLLGIRKYGHGVDTWSMGCMLAELLSQTHDEASGETGRFIPLFPGDSEIGQLFKIFQLTGTPDERLWRGVTSIQFMNQAFPKWEVGDDHIWIDRAPRADVSSLDLIRRSLTLDPNNRLTCKDALKHPFLNGTYEAHRTNLMR